LTVAALETIEFLWGIPERFDETEGAFMMPRLIGMGCLFLLLTELALPARAALVISIGNTSIAQGSTGTIDVWASSTAGSSMPDLINDYGFTLQITGPNELQFSSVQSFSYLNNAQYLFFNDSTDQMTSSAGGSVLTTTYVNDTFVGNDSTFSGNPVNLSSGSSPLLLATLSLSALITNAGDMYTISLVPDHGDGSMNTSAKTFFDVVDFAGTGQETSHVPYSSTAGTVTITAAAVPEPPSLITSSIAIGLVWGSVVLKRFGLHPVGTGGGSPT
jgi:hypothetical protein